MEMVMIAKETIEQLARDMGLTERPEPLGDGLRAFEWNGQLVMVLDDRHRPVRVDLRCDSQLAGVLRERYESVLPSSQLHPRKWNTVICSGQLSLPEVQDLVRHSFELVQSEQAADES